MRGVSRASLAEAKERLEAALSAGDPSTLGDELFALLHLLDREHGLRRVLSDPAQPAERKAEAARSLLAGSLSADTLGVVEDVVRLRWARSPDLTDALEELAVTAVEALYGQALLMTRRPLRAQESALLNRAFIGLLDHAMHEPREEPK